MSEIIALIPARGGSKGIPNKNVRKLAGLSLIGWSILAARHAKFDRVVVSTDSPEIAEVARSMGAEVPFLRPASLAQDRSLDREYVVHALDSFRDEGTEPAYIAIIRPTTPVRSPEVLDAAVQAIVANPAATALRSVHELPEPPQKMMGIEDGWLVGLFPHDPRPEYYNLPRQIFPSAYHPNGYIDIVTRDWIRLSESGIFGPRVIGFVTEPVVEIDLADAFDLVEFQISRRRPALLDLPSSSVP
jgi:CMP-N,N'-diacetyllegionaminic acid synthase